MGLRAGFSSFHVEAFYEYVASTIAIFAAILTPSAKTLLWWFIFE
jgi:hypothetical protein